MPQSPHASCNTSTTRLQHEQNLLLSLGTIDSLVHSASPIQTIIEPATQSRKLNGGIRTLAQPHPARPIVRRLLISLQSTTGLNLVQAASVNDPSIADGTLQWRCQLHSNNKIVTQKPSSSNKQKRRRKSFIFEQPTYTTSSHSQLSLPNDIMTVPPSQSIYTFSNPNLSNNLSASTSIKPKLSSYRLRVDTTFKAEVKRQGKLDTFHASIENTHLGHAKFSYIPEKKISTSLLVRQAIITSNCVSSTPLITEKKGSSHDIPKVTLEEIRCKLLPPNFAVNGTKQYPSRIQPLKNVTRPLKIFLQTLKRPKKSVQVQNSEPKPSAPVSKKSSLSSRDEETVALIANGRRSFKIDTDYVSKDKRLTVNTMFEGTLGRELSLRILSNPTRLFPRIRTPVHFLIPFNRSRTNELVDVKSEAKLKKGQVPKTSVIKTMSYNASTPWVCWMPELGRSWTGEMQVGWKEFSLSSILNQGVLALSQSKKDGSGFGVVIMTKNKSGKIEKTLVRKALKGKLSVSMNGIVGNQKDQTGVTLTLHQGPSSISVYGKTSKSFGLAMDSNFYIKHNYCRVALRTDDLKSASLRLGWFC